MTETPNNEATFSVDDWLADANLPEESTVVYKRADVISELTRLKHEIEIEQEADGERSAADASPTKELERKYQHLINVFGDSALTVYVRALTPDEKGDIRKASDEAAEKGSWDNVKANRDHAARLLSKAVVGVKEPRDEARKDVFWAPATIIKMEDKLGSVQMSHIMHAYQTAQNAMPSVDADFLHTRSGSGATHD